MRVLEFTKQEDKYVCEFSSSGPEVIQIERPKNGHLQVNIHLEGMSPIPYRKAINRIALISLNVPSGMIVSIESDVEVTQAKGLSGITTTPVPFSSSDEPICYDSNEEALFVNY